MSEEIPEHELTPIYFHTALREHAVKIGQVQKKVGIGIVEGEEEGEFVTRQYMKKHILPQLKEIQDGQTKTQVIITGISIAAAIIYFLMHVGVFKVGG